MRALLWVLALFAAAVGITVAARYNPGYIIVVLPAHRVELSLALGVALVLAAVIALYLVMRAVGFAAALPRQVREFRQRQREAQIRRALIDAMQALFEGRLAKARQAAARAIEEQKGSALTSVVAARAAHGLRDFEARDEYLRRMETIAPGETVLRLMTQAELLLDERRYLDALRALDAMPEKHTAALRLELRAQQLAGNWERVLSLLPQLDKRRVFEPAAMVQVKRAAYVGAIRHRGADINSLREFWQRIPASDRRDVRVAAAAARSFIERGAGAEAAVIIEAALAEEWDAALVARYAECSMPGSTRQLERAEGWLKDHPGDPALLLTLGRLCAREKLYGKARSYLGASLALEPSHLGYVELGRLAEQAGKHDEANDCYRRALELALASLEDSGRG